MTLQVDGLRKSYGDIEALKSLSFSLAPGQCTALLGPNGAGKSTAIKILVSLLAPDDGTYRWQDQDLLADTRRIRDLVGYVSQALAMDKVLTGLEFMRFCAGILHLPWRQHESRARELLATMELTEAQDRPVGDYSGGMMRRLDLAVAMLNEPRVLVLDEPTTGLDVEAKERLWQLLNDFKEKGGCIVLASHDFREVAEMADDVLILRQGAVIRRGEAEQLKADLGKYIVRIKTAEFMSDTDVKAIRAAFEDWDDQVAWHDHEAFALFVYDGEHDMTNLQQHAVAAMETAGLSIHTLSVQRPDLEDVYRLAVGGDA